MHLKPLSLSLALALGPAFQLHPAVTEPFQADPVRVVSKRERVPGSAHVIGKAELAKQQEPDLQRLLYQVPGVFIQEEEGHGTKPNIGIRGTGVERSQKVTLMEDGILAAPAAYSAPAAYYSPNPLRMDAVEVLKGSSQIKHGPHTNGGAVNMVSAAIPEGGPLAGRLSAEAGERGLKKARLDLGGTTGRAGWLVQAAHFGEDGFKRPDYAGPHGFGVTEGLLKLRLGSAPQDLPQWAEIKLGLSREDSKETYLGLTQADFDATPHRRYASSQVDNIQVAQNQAVLRWGITLLEGLDFQAAAYRQDVHRNWYKLNDVRGNSSGAFVGIGSVLNDPAAHALLYDVLTGVSQPANADTLRVRANNRRYLSQGVEGKLAHSSRWRSLRSRLEAGVRYHEDSEDRHHWDDLYAWRAGQMALGQAGVPGSQTNAIAGARATATFAQVHLEAGRLGLSPGIRYEDITYTLTNWRTAPAENGRVSERPTYSRRTSVALPGLGATLKVAEGLTLLGGVHRGFSPGGISVSGTDVNETFSELSTNYEAGFRATGRAWEAEVIGFYNDYENLLGKDSLAGGGAGSQELFNGGKSRVQGLELSLGLDPGRRLGWAFGVPLSAALTLTDAVFLNGFTTSFQDWAPAVAEGDQIPYIPRLQASAKAGLEAGPASLGLILRHVAEVRTKAGQGAPAAAESVPAHTVADLNAGWAYAPGARFFVNVKNLADTVYLAARRPAGLRPGLPRTVSGGVSLEF